MNQFGLSAESFTAAPKVVGMKQTLKKLANGEMDRVVLSRDCDDGIALQVKEACAAAKVPCVTAGSKKDLGRACGIERPAAVVGFVKAPEPSPSEDH